jgi:tetratricopeptide (TPR) repeat protein
MFPLVSLIIPPTKNLTVKPGPAVGTWLMLALLLVGMIGVVLFQIAAPVSADTQTEIAISLVQKGDDLMLQKRYYDALDAYEESVTIDPYNSISWNKLGVAHMTTGRYEDAVLAFRKATDIDPYYTDAWNNMGDSLAVLGRHQEAIEAYDRALRIDQNDLYALLHKGISLQETGDSAQAMDIYEEVISLADREMRKHPNYAEFDAEIWALKGEALYRLGRFEEAVTAYDAALQINPKYDMAIKGKSMAMDAILLSRGTTPETTAVPATDGNGVAPLPTVIPLSTGVVFGSIFAILAFAARKYLQKGP